MMQWFNLWEELRSVPYVLFRSGEKWMGLEFFLKFVEFKSVSKVVVGVQNFMEESLLGGMVSE